MARDKARKLWDFHAGRGPVKNIIKIILDREYLVMITSV
jgi:hypothetical protein